MSKPTCPVCGKNVDLTIDLQTQKEVGVVDLGDVPDPIDLCANCGALLKIQQLQPLRYRTMSDREFQTLAPLYQRRIKEAQDLIRFEKKKGN